MIDISQRFFHYLPDADIQEWSLPPGRSLRGQSYGGSCVAACVRMLLDDFGLNVPEAYIRNAVGVDALTGGFISKVPEGLEELGFPRDALYEPALTLPSLRWHAGKSAVIVSVSLAGYGTHALVVDSFAGEYVNLRDPLPVAIGSTYGVHQDDFTKAWGGKAVVIP